MAVQPQESLTLLLILAQQGDRNAENRAIRQAYGKLRTMAAALLRRERAGHTLQATALVSEVFVQKLRRLSTPIHSREHFYSLAASAMRQVLIDHARRARSQRRHLDAAAVVDWLTGMADNSLALEDRLALQQALDELKELDPRAAECIRCRFTLGLTIHEAAAQLDMPAWRVRDNCDFALGWLSERLRRRPRPQQAC